MWLSGDRRQNREETPSCFSYIRSRLDYAIFLLPQAPRNCPTPYCIVTDSSLTVMSCVSRQGGHEAERARSLVLGRSSKASWRKSHLSWVLKKGKVYGECSKRKQPMQSPGAQREGALNVWVTARGSGEGSGNPTKVSSVTQEPESPWEWVR